MLHKNALEQRVLEHTKRSPRLPEMVSCGVHTSCFTTTAETSAAIPCVLHAALRTAFVFAHLHLVVAVSRVWFWTRCSLFWSVPTYTDRKPFSVAPGDTTRSAARFRGVSMFRPESQSRVAHYAVVAPSPFFFVVPPLFPPRPLFVMPGRRGMRSRQPPDAVRPVPLGGYAGSDHGTGRNQEDGEGEQAPVGAFFCSFLFCQDFPFFGSAVLRVHDGSACFVYVACILTSAPYGYNYSAASCEPFGCSHGVVRPEVPTRAK